MTALAERSSSASLAGLFAGIAPLPCARDLPVQGLALDSREVGPGYVFLALRGHDHHGLRHLAQARARGAVAVAYDPDGAEEYLAALAGLPAIAVAHLDREAGAIAARFYADPSAALQVLAVTGTNGKTSVSELSAQALAGLGRPCGLIGTLGYGVYGSALVAPAHTTPDAVQLQRWLARFRDQRVGEVSMEASSHALDQCRLNGVHVRAAAFTNLTRDHLDYHGTMAAYAAAKRRLFELPGLRCAILNLDDAFGRELAATLVDSVQIIGYTLGGQTAARARMLRAERVELHADGLRFALGGDFGTGLVAAPLLGRFNVYNLLAVLGLLLAADITFADAVAALARARTVPGRMECLGGGAHRPLVVVDYAHTPDALEKALEAARSHCRGELWCVFGCGGERDRGKRPQMGAIAERLADRVIVTDDNPRHEDAAAIIAEITAGMRVPSRALVQQPRVRAIATALDGAHAADVILIAGKGHEDYQLIGDEKIPYSDRATVQRLLGEGVA